MTYPAALGLLGLVLAVSLVAAAGTAAGTTRSAGSLMVSLSATPSYGGPPLVVTFEASVSTGIPTSYNWSFGDGTFYNGTNSSAARPAHVYSNPGSYAASVEVFEGLNSGEASIAIHVVAQALAVQIAASAVNGDAPLSVWFNSTVSGGTETYVNFSWVFGDGGSGSGSSLRYTFTRAGNFHVMLAVHDSGNASASAGVWVNVTSSTTTNSVDWSTVGQLSPWFVGGLVAGALGFWLARRSEWARPREAKNASHVTGTRPNIQRSRNRTSSPGGYHRSGARSAPARIEISRGQNPSDGNLACLPKNHPSLGKTRSSR